jgi:hypothetical protein
MFGVWSLFLGNLIRRAESECVAGLLRSYWAMNCGLDKKIGSDEI